MNKLKVNNCFTNEEIVLLLDTYFLEINYLKKTLILLDKHKPFFFKFNKLKNYKKEREIIINKINLYENKIADIINKQS